MKKITRIYSCGALPLLLAAGFGCVDGATLERQLADKNAELARARRENLESRAALAECREEKSDRAERAAALAPIASATPSQTVPQTAPSVSAAPAVGEPRPGASSAVPANPPAAPEIESEAENYRNALALINARQTAAARVAMDRFAQRFPDSKFRPNAAFWRAETDFLDGQWETARMGFARLAENFPFHPKAADSLYKAAICSLNLGDKSTAIQQLNDVLRRFPHSDAAGFAQKKLAELSKKT